MIRMIIFDDDQGSFGPMTHLRASFELRTGMLTTAGRLAAWREKTLAGYWVPEHLREVVAERANAPVNVMLEEEEIICANGRWALPEKGLDLQLGEALLEAETGHLIVAHLRRADAELLLTKGILNERVNVHRREDRSLYQYPWDILDRLPVTLTHDILSNRILDAKVLTNMTPVVGENPVEVHTTALLSPNVVFDATNGPIKIHEGAVIRPGVVLCGPCAIGSGTTIVDQCVIKSNTSIGPLCKVGGEVGGTIFQGCSNKAHEGHLGDSWLGKWVNLGAGTTNSNLLNTYGEVSMRLDANDSRHRTGRQFMGAIVGDHVKTAIGTRIMTGTTIGTGAMIASSTPPPDLVEPFTWLTDDGKRKYRFNKFVDVMTTVMARRDRTPGVAYVKRLEELHNQGATDSEA
ncbi:MAG: putative sugar nucleotidyl transferase [Planctomycetota bacterium]|nr:putative sugar nucleotidyl transferase [Planctomycetota bacterium]